MNMLKKLSPLSRRFFYTWLVLTGIILIISASVLFTTSWESHIIKLKVEELRYHPQVQQQVAQMKQQGVSDQRINQQLEQYALPQAAPGIKTLKSTAKRSAFIFIVVTFLLYFLLVSGKNAPFPRTWLIALLIVFLIAELMYVAGKYILVQDTAQFDTTPEAITWLKEQNEPFRVATLDIRAYQDWIAHQFPLHGIECIHVLSDSRISPLRKTFFNSGKMSPIQTWQYSNVKYVLGERRQLQQVFRQLGVKDSFKEKKQFNKNGAQHAVFEYTDTLPRIYAIGSTIINDDLDSAIAIMSVPTTDPHSFAVINDTNAPVFKADNFTSEVNITDYTPEKIIADVTLSATGMVILATEPYKGWQASIDDTEAKIYRCNLLHQGVITPPGNHTVIFSFHASSPFIKLNKISYSIIPILLLLTVTFGVFRFMKTQKAIN